MQNQLLFDTQMKTALYKTKLKANITTRQEKIQQQRKADRGKCLILPHTGYDREIS